MRTVGDHDQPDLVAERRELPRHLVHDDRAEGVTEQEVRAVGLHLTDRRSALGRDLLDRPGASGGPCIAGNHSAYTGWSGPTAAARCRTVTTAPPRIRQNSGGFEPSAGPGTPRRRAATARTRNAVGHGPHRGAGEEDGRGKPSAEGLFDVDQQLGRVQRVAAELEEVLVRARRLRRGRAPAARCRRAAFDVVGRLDVEPAPVAVAAGPSSPKRRGQASCARPCRSPRGISSTTTTRRGTLYGASRSADEEPQLRGGHVRAVAGARPRRRRPHPAGVRDAKATASTTSGCSSSASSISRGRDLLATAVDELLQPPGDGEVAVVVEAPLITGAEPAVEERAGVRLGVVEVPATSTTPRMPISPIAPARERRCPASSSTATSGPAGQPDAFPACGPAGAAGCSSSGARPRSSRRPRSPGRRTPPRVLQHPHRQRRRRRSDEPERRRQPAPSRRGRPATSSIAWWIVGTAVYQVGRSSSIHPGRRARVEPGRCTRRCRRRRVTPSSAATMPWMWKSGITLRQRSSGPSPSVAATLRGRRQQVCSVSGTSFGATRRARGEQQQRRVGSLAHSPAARRHRRRVRRARTAPAVSRGSSSITGMPERRCRGACGVSCPREHHHGTRHRGRSAAFANSASGRSGASGAHTAAATVPSTATAASGPFGSATATRPLREIPAGAEVLRDLLELVEQIDVGRRCPPRRQQRDRPGRGRAWRAGHRRVAEGPSRTCPAFGRSQSIEVDRVPSLLGY